MPPNTGTGSSKTAAGYMLLIAGALAAAGSAMVGFVAYGKRPR